MDPIYQMRRRYLALIPIALVFLLLFLLTRIDFAHYPDRTLTGLTWDKKWEGMGTVMGIAEPGNGFRLLENNSVLTGEETWYASYVTGEASDYTNAEGKPVDLYPAQIYVLLYGCADKASAERALSDWSEKAAENCSVLSEETAVHNGMSYTIASYRINKDAESDPYDRKVSAFARYDRYAVVIELTCTETYTGDPEAVMADFLDHCHYDGALQEG